MSFYATIVILVEWFTPGSRNFCRKKWKSTHATSLTAFILQENYFLFKFNGIFILFENVNDFFRISSYSLIYKTLHLLE